MSFPTSPTDGQIYKDKIFSTGAWKNITSLTGKFVFSSNYSHPSNWARLPFDTAVYNNIPMVHSNSTFKPTNPGTYRITVSGYSSSSHPSEYRYAIGARVNSVLEGFTGDRYGNSDDSPLTGYVGLVQVNGTTDVIDVAMFSAGSGFDMPAPSASKGHNMILYIEYVGV